MVYTHIVVHTHIYSHRRQEFQNILERKLPVPNCHGQLCLVYWKKNVEHGRLEMSEFYGRFHEHHVIYTDDEFDSLLVSR